ncbi:MAG: DUF2232 domain-containing protein [Leptolyngbyaceae bacterium]|nr:DUF2232 domain-containing protein [Leptolyngbyaceae bacterium]
MSEPILPSDPDSDRFEPDSTQPDPTQREPTQPNQTQTGDHPLTNHSPNADVNDADEAVSWEEVEAVLAEPLESSDSTTTMPSSNPLPYVAPLPISDPPLALVETAFLASTASLLWLISYYLSIGPWMRILFPIPIALVYLRWGGRSGWMAAVVTGLLLSVLMGPYLSILFLIPYGILGVQLGFLWQRQVGWGISITIGTIVSTFSLFFRLWLLSTFLGEDLWIYLTGRITDLLEWIASILVNWGILGVGMLGQPAIHLVQLATIGMILFSDFVYLFTIHLTAWLLMERLGVPISQPPQWVQVILDEA